MISSAALTWQARLKTWQVRLKTWQARLKIWPQPAEMFAATSPQFHCVLIFYIYSK